MISFKKFLEESAAWQRKVGKNPEGGLNRKGIASYRSEHPGSKLSMAVTTPPSKLKAGGMIKRADGSYSQRGLWDNIRANKGSGKKPTKQMLQQEKKIKAKTKK